MNGPLRWHGGKQYLAKKIIELLPPRDGSRPWYLWREPFFGGGAVTLHLNPEGLSEAVNDLHSELVNFWSVLRNNVDFYEFVRRLQLTPFAQEEFEGAKMYHDLLPGDSGDRVTGALAFFITCRQSRQGLMRDFATPTRRVRRGLNENVSAWLSAVEGLPEIHERLRRIEIRNMDAIAFIKKYDDPFAVFYLDPPYLHETRSTGGGEYRHEMTQQQHSQLLAELHQIKGRFLLSGYRSSLYDQCAEVRGWRRVDFDIDNKASSNSVKEIRTECVWMNY